MQERYDVAIVGYGPVGQSLAILLGERGWNVGVLEKQPSPYPLPRAVHFDHEIARILQGLGLGDELAKLAEPADVYEWKNAAGETLLLIGAKHASVSGWPEANMFSQPDLERALDRRARALPSVEVARGCEVVDLRSGADGVDLAIDDRASGRRQVRASWVIGCDGANSFVREHLDATISDLGFFYDWLIVDVIPREARVWDPINGQICDPARPTTVVSGGPGRRRWEFMRLPGEEIDDLNNAATAWRLLAPWSLDPSNATLERHAVYTFQARFVDRWRKGRVFIAGDAAHRMPPFAGQGMCAGIRDAANLAWKLHLVLAGKAPDAILDSYTSERIPQVREVIEFSIGLGKVICVPDPAEAAARDRAMIEAARERGLTPPLPQPTIGPGITNASDPHAGELFLQATVARGANRGRFDDVVGRGFVLASPVGDPANALDPELAAFFVSIGGTVVSLADGSSVRDVDGAYGKWFADRGIAVALQRPDFHLFGTATAVDGAAALVRSLRDALAVSNTRGD
jgi:flavoprotein hydroxylase